MKVINLWAGPGAGKSTAAAGLFYKMKHSGKRVELVTEFAKELVYEESAALPNNLLILAEQDHRLRRLIGQVDFAITDSPLPLSILYAKAPFDTQWFADAAISAFNTYDNVNFLVKRSKPYQNYGRTQTEEDAIELDRRVEGLLATHGLPSVAIVGDDNAPEVLMRFLFNGSVRSA